MNNDLQQTKKLLEDKIALTKSSIEQKQKEHDRLKKDVDELAGIIVNLNQELWKDEFALEAVNEEISQIPTLAVQKTNPLWKTFKIGLAFLLLTSTTFGQDTIHARKVRIAEHVGISMKTGKVLYARPVWRKVKSGFFIKKSNDLYIINGKEYHPGNHKPLKIKK